MINFFDLLGLTPGYALNTTHLEKAFLQKQKNLSNLDGEVVSLDACALNQAHQTLLDPVKRAFHILELCGIQAMDYRDSDTDTLEYVMELKETLDNTDDPDSISLAINDAQASLTEAESVLVENLSGQVVTDAISNVQSASSCDNQWMRLVACNAIKLKYLQNLINHYDKHHNLG